VARVIGYADLDDPDEREFYMASCFPPPEAPSENSQSVTGLAHWHTGPWGSVSDPDIAQWGGTGQLVVVNPGPEFEPPQPSLLELWVDAVNRLEMVGPQIASAPPIDTNGLVRLPVWLWTEDRDETWPDEPRYAAAPETPTGGLWFVEAWAEPVEIVWDMGDGRAPVECNRPGIPWAQGLNLVEPPGEACHHTYYRPSRDEPGGVFEIVAITTWRVWWHINGEFDDELEVQVGTTTTYQVNEIQVVTRG
jgi:hypothetical protein